MYLRKTERRNRDGSTVAYYALAENGCNPETGRSEARVIHSFGRADQLGTAALRRPLRRPLRRLVASINRVLEAGDGAAAEASLGEIEIDAAFDLGVVLAARGLWEELGTGPAVRSCLARAGLAA